MAPPKFYETKDFLKLDNEWQKKLEESGFEDAENKERNLKEWDGQQFKRTTRNRDSVVYMESKIEYYRLASRFLHEYKFEDNISKVIWELHADGLSKTETVKAIKKLRLIGNIHKVKYVIKKLQVEMRELYIKND